MSVHSFNAGLSWRSAAVVFLVLFGYGMKASIVDTSAVMSDLALAAANDVETAVWDTTPPTATSIRITNGGAASNAPDPGDVITIGFSEPIDLTSIKSGWDGTATTITGTIGDNDKSYSDNDTVTFNVNLGIIDLGGAEYTGKPNTILDASMVWNDKQDKVEITLGAYSRDKAGTTTARTDATFYPDPAVQDTGRISIDTAVTPVKTDRHF